MFINVYYLNMLLYIHCSNKVQINAFVAHYQNANWHKSILNVFESDSNRDKIKVTKVCLNHHSLKRNFENSRALIIKIKITWVNLSVTFFGIIPWSLFSTEMRLPSENSEFKTRKRIVVACHSQFHRLTILTGDTEKKV